MASVAPTPTKARPAVPPSVASKSLEELQVLFVDVREVLISMHVGIDGDDDAENECLTLFLPSSSLPSSLFLGKRNKYNFSL